jgi:multidrug efflux system membrane fusion protein
MRWPIARLRRRPRLREGDDSVLPNRPVLFYVATTVGVAVAEAADIPVNMEALGTVVPQATVRVRPQVSGVLTQVLFKEGQSVKRGQLLATIDPRPFEMALQQALGQRMRDEAQLAAARVTLERFETLLKQDSIARQEVDTQRATVHQLEATVVSSKAPKARPA